MFFSIIAYFYRWVNQTTQIGESIQTLQSDWFLSVGKGVLPQKSIVHRDNGHKTNPNHSLKEISLFGFSGMKKAKKDTATGIN